MRLRFAAMFLAVGGLAGLAGAATAQTINLHVGPRLSYNFDAEEFGVGAQLSVPVARRLEFYPSFDYYFVEPGSLTSLNVDLKYRVPAEGLRWLYVGGGINFTRVSFGEFENTDTGANIIAGYESIRGRVHPFAEFRLTAGDGSQAQISAGLNFTLGH